MDGGPQLETSRLILRRWRESDIGPFAALNTDPDVMEHFPSHLDRDQTAAFVERIERSFDENGYGLWAVEHALSQQFLGYVGLAAAHFEAHFTPAVEVGWRLSTQYWGSGYASEAAAAAIRFGFEKVGLDEIVSFTVPANRRSIRVMERLGMTRDPREDFEHPAIEAGSPLRRHVLYRLPAARWAATHQT